MRPTTKIILGIILSLFLLSLLFMIGFSFTDRKHFQSSYLRTIEIPSANKTGINIEPYRVITLESEQSGREGGSFCSFNNEDNGLFIHSATTPDEENKLFISEALHGFISTKTSKDTLFLKIDLEKVREQYGDEVNKGFKPGIRDGVPVAGVNLYLHASNVNVINKLEGVQTRISHIETDSIKIQSLGDVVIDSCKAIVIEPTCKSQLTISNCTAQVLNFDLDQLNNWKTEACTIEVTNFTGSTNANIRYDNNERGTIHWRPKNKDGKITLTIKGETSLQLMQPSCQVP